MTMGRGFYALTSGYVSPLPFTLYRPQAIGTGIGSAAPGAAVQLFPNPASDIVRVQGLPSGTGYAVFGMLGHMVARDALTASRTIDVGGLRAGLYLLELPGVSVVPQRLVVSR